MESIDLLMTFLCQTELKCARQQTTEHLPCLLIKGFILTWIINLGILLPATIINSLLSSSFLNLVSVAFPASFIIPSHPSVDKPVYPAYCAFQEMKFCIYFVTRGNHFLRLPFLRQSKTKFFSSDYRKIIRCKYEIVEIKQGNNCQ